MLTIDWPTKVITVPQADLTPLGGGVFELDIDAFRLELKAIEASAEGMPFVDTHLHNPEVTFSGLTLARVVQIINGFTVTFEDGQYAVNLIGANSNISDVATVNQVSTRAFNAPGLISVSSGTAPTKSEIQEAVLEAIVEGSVTFEETLRVLLAVLTGDATGLESAPAFKSLDGLKTRVAGTIVGGVRTKTTLDGT